MLDDNMLRWGAIFPPQDPQAQVICQQIMCFQQEYKNNSKGDNRACDETGGFAILQ
jgi:hypothetical protein